MEMDPDHRDLVTTLATYLADRPEYHTVKTGFGEPPYPEPVNGELPDITAFRRHQFVIFRAFTEQELADPTFEAVCRAFAKCAAFEHIRFHAIVPARCGDEQGRVVAQRQAAELGVRIDNVWEV